MLASQLLTARRQGRQVDAADFTPPADSAAAYAVQAEVIRLAGLDLAGWKAGATNPPTQQRLDLTEPFLGPLFAGTVHPSGGEVPVVFGHTPALETEFTAVLAGDLPPRDAPYTRDDVRIASLHPSFEVVAPRFSGVERNRGLMSIADAGGNGGMVLGPALDLSAGGDPFEAEVVLTFDGAEVARGSGRVLMWTDVTDAVLWLANRPQVAPRGLRAGDVIMTGTMTGLIPFQPGVTARAQFGTMGAVEATFVAG
ncbi:MAG: fumarylacetoacetate hydrolase family protein [Hyphomicrobiales bacterium]|nr:fumarylacetoacetate hydrolase family protein [Hyphomicrobiales bacterium]MCP5373297.1 fumarylacetoacetate hydrolase family protein [Hyphomicrobiales bacterium]